MGNQSSTRNSKGATARRDLELPSLHPIRVLNSHTTFTTFLCAYADGTHVVVKRASRDDVGADHASYREAMRSLEERLESASTASTSHVWADQQIIETTGAVHVVRQYFAQSLASRPLCATFEEKLWIAWQILWGLRCVHVAIARSPADRQPIGVCLRLHAVILYEVCCTPQVTASAPNLHVALALNSCHRVLQGRTCGGRVSRRPQVGERHADLLGMGVSQKSDTMRRSSADEIKYIRSLILTSIDQLRAVSAHRAVSLLAPGG